MIPTFKNFSIFKAKSNDNPKLPTHALSMKIGEEFVNIGGAWTKDSTNGKFLSCKLADTWVNSQDNTKTRKGLVIVFEEDLKHLEELANPQDTTAIDPETCIDLNQDSPF